MLSLEETVTRAVYTALDGRGEYFRDRHDNVYHIEPMWKFDGDKNVNKGRYIYALRFSSGYVVRDNIIYTKHKDDDILSISYGREKLISLILGMVEWRESW